jgi:malonyl-CoA O-methyltransferase
MSVELINKQAIAKSFGRAASQYDSAAHFQRWVGSELSNKIPAKPVSSILDLGCGTGYFSDALCEQFPAAQYIGLDLSEDMVRYSQKLRSTEQHAWLTADAESLPFKTDSLDLVYSSLSIQWCSNLRAMFSEVHRVLKVGGVFVFSSLVDGSLYELKRAWSEVDSAQHVNEFAFIDDYKQALSGLGYSVTTLNVEEKVLRYNKVNELTRELRTLGAHNITAHRPTNMTGKQKLKQFVSAYESFRQSDGMLPATYQVLWGVLQKT